VAACALGACRGEVDITVALAPQLPTAAAAATSTLDFVMSGADSAHAVRTTAKAFASGSERIVFNTHASGSLSIAVSALDDTDHVLASGSTNVRLNGQSVILAQVVLDRGDANLIGASCAADIECTTGFCVDGVCCDKRCDGQCEACNASTKGMCATVSGAPVPPRPACGDGSPCGLACDGQHRDACALPGTQTVCVAPSCEDGHAVTARCDGAGTCHSRSTPCGSFACNSGVCATACASDADCGPRTYCASPTQCLPWDPSLLSGVVLWLDPDRGLSSSAPGNLTWKDQSGKGNDAVAEGLPLPTQIATTNGHSGVHFAGGDPSGGNLDLGDAPSLQWGTGSFVVVVVTRFHGVSASVLYLKHDHTQYPFPGVGLSATDPSGTGPTAVHPVTASQSTQYGCNSGTSFNDDKWHIIAMHRAAAGALELRIDGVLRCSHTYAALNVSAPGFRAGVGGRVADGWAPLFGDVAEVVAFVGSDSPTDVTRLESYLKDKYGL
jgi:hypothetical protein